MADDGVTQRVAAILAADAAGYTRLMGADERATIDALDAARAVFIEHVEANQGRIVDTAGDSVLAVFEIAAGAVRAAVAIQERLAEINEPVPEARRMRFRIGIHLGDIHEKTDGSVYGDGVNVAARLEGLAEPGTIVVSDIIQGAVRGRLNQSFADLGEHEVKNVAEPVRAYRVLAEGEVVPAAAKPGRARQLALAGTAVVVAAVIAVALWPSPEPPPLTDVATADPEDPILAMPSGPSIAVLPLESLGGDTDQVWFAEGLTEEIIAGLSKFRELLVYASDTSSQYAGQDARSIGEALGVRYVVKGSVQRGGERVRVSVRLLDTASGAQLWSENYDEALEAEALFAVQDAIRERIVGTLAGSYGVLSQAGLEDAHARGTDNLTAYDCVLSAYDYERVFTPARHAEVRDCLERAVELDPDYADAWAKLAFVTTDEYAWGFNPRPDPMKRAMEAARKAVALDPTSQTTRWHMARTHYWNGDREAFFLEAEKALALNPNNSFVLAAAGAYYAIATEYERGAALARKAMAINPHYPTWYHFPTYWDFFSRGLYEEALAEAHRIDLPGYYWTHAVTAAAAGMAGNLGAAKAGVIALQETYPGFTLESAHEELAKGVERPEGDDLEARFIEGLRLAGVPEAPPVPSRPVIAVLPFDNMSGDPEQEYFADGITEDIITRLTRFEGLKVIARTSTFQFKDAAADVRSVAEALGASHIVQGSVRRSGSRIRVSAQLLDAAEAGHLWSDEFDRDYDVNSIFDIQDEITDRITSTIADAQGILSRVAVRSVETAGPQDLESYECILLARYYIAAISLEKARQARACLEAVTREEPDYADAWGWLAFMYGQLAVVWLANDADDLTERSTDAAGSAIALDPTNQVAHLVLAHLHFRHRDCAGFEHEAELAIAANPNHTNTLNSIAWRKLGCGDREEAVALAYRTLELNPLPLPYVYSLLGIDCYIERDYTCALENARRGVTPGSFWSYIHMAIALAELGREAEARAAVEEVLALEPDFVAKFWPAVDYWFFGQPELIERFVSSLAKAGLDIPPRPLPIE